MGNEPKGHRNLAIRGAAGLCQGFLSLILVSYEIDIPHALPTALLQFWGSATLLVQWRTANPYMFILRAIPNYIRGFVSLHAATCGRTWPGGECVVEAWQDERLPLRICHCFACIIFFLTGLSLTLQFKFPKRGVGVRGNEQLFYRGCIRAMTLPLHFVRAMLKIGELSGTEFERSPVEIGVNLLRGCVLNPIATWSLLNQWVATGSGKQTDDVRTSNQGPVVLAGAADSMANYLEPHQGHRDLLVRSALSLGQGFTTFWLLVYDIDVPHKLPQMFCQFIACYALWLQWRVGRERMFIVRALACFLRAALLVHLAVCGRTTAPFWGNGHCSDDAWNDVRRPFRILHGLASVRMFLIAASLLLQFLFPRRGVTANYGNEQLFYRGCLRATGVALYLAMAASKMYYLEGTDFHRLPIEIAADFLRGTVWVPLQAWSLLHQWRYTGEAADKTGRYSQMQTPLPVSTEPKQRPSTFSGAEETADVEPETDAMNGHSANGGLNGNAYLDIRISRTVAAGTSGRVDSLVGLAPDGGKYVIKSVSCQSEKERLIRSLEAQLLREVTGHPSLIRYNYSWFDPDDFTVHLLMEHCGQALWSWVFSLGNQHLTDELKLDWSLQLADGLQHLYAHGIMHRDISPWSVFVSSGCNGSAPHLVIGDFGMACRLQESGAPQEPFMPLDSGATSRFSAPELEVAGREGTTEYDVSADVFSLGMVIIFMWDSPREESLLGSRLDAVKETGMLPEDTAVNQKLRRLLTQMVSHNPRDRDDISTVVTTLKKVLLTAIPGVVIKSGPKLCTTTI